VAEPTMLKTLANFANNPGANFSYCNFQMVLVTYPIKFFKEIKACDFSLEKLKQNNYIHAEFD
jgi:hypothetical protein